MSDVGSIMRTSDQPSLRSRGAEYGFAAGRLLCKYKWWVAILVISLVVFVGVGRHLKAASRSPIRTDKEVLAKIHLGMTVAEVEEIIGAPPGSYVTWERIPTFLHNGWYEQVEGQGHISEEVWASTDKQSELRSVRWQSNEGEIALGLDYRNRVRLKLWKSISVHRPWYDMF